MSSSFFGREKSLHQLLGGGKVADIALWRNKRQSTAVLIGITTVWMLFEVAEYHFLTVLCNAAITAMLFVFIWSNAAALLDLPPPRIPDIILSEKVYKQAVMAFHRRLNWALTNLHDIARGRDLKLFLRTIGFLWVFSVLTSSTSSLNILFLVVLCLMTVPTLYEQYEHEINHLAIRGKEDLRKLYKNMDKSVINKIPRGPAKEKYK
ncbi:hypothetical protein LUZ60_009929 [Juncus effusus]|nr:hypothetical protein LUZ60_009929 [Juncus effusus]